MMGTILRRRSKSCRAMNHNELLNFGNQGFIWFKINYINEGLQARLVLLIKGNKFVNFSTPEMAAKNNDKHCIDWTV